MKFLVVEGNVESTRIERGDFGIKPYYKVFTEMLHFFNPTFEIDVVFPADSEKGLPTTEKLKQYNGVLWTGSSLSVLEAITPVAQQLNFAETVFKSHVPMYGSCWGMQIATVVAGGKVVKSENGLEIGVSKPIRLTDFGKKSALFKDRPHKFKALCIHYDEISVIPENAEVLATNEHSKVQALVFEYLNTPFFGVQYHPEFNASDMSLIVSFLSKKLIDTGYFSSQETADKFLLQLQDEKYLTPEILNYNLHTQDIRAWINNNFNL